MPLTRTLIAGLLALGAAGCGLPPWGGSLPRRRPLGREHPTYPPPLTSGPTGADAGGRCPVATEPTGDLALRQALALALASSPELASFAWDVRRAEAEQLQAGMLPNPEVEAEFGNFAGSGGFRGTRALETTIGLSQLVELGGKRRKRVALARADSKLAGWDYEAKRLAVLTEVAKRFVAVLATQERLGLAGEGLALAEATLDAAAKRVAAGKAAPTEKSRALVEVASARICVGRLQRQLKAAAHKLAATWGGRQPKFSRAVGRLTSVARLPPVEGLVAKLAQNPDLARWAEEISQRRAALAVEKARVVPDVTIGVGYRHFRDTEENDRAMLVSVGIPVPAFDQIRGAIAKARFGVMKARAGQAAAEAKARADLEQAYQTLAAAHLEAVSLRDEVLPAARASYEAARKSYQAGKTEFLDIVDAQRTLVATREQYVEALASYHHAVADVEGLIGESLVPVDTAGPHAKEITDEDPE